MNFLRIFFLFAFLANVFNAEAEKLLLHTDDLCKVWWTGSTYKIMRNESVPLEKGKIIIRAAKNETESFQLVLTPFKTLENTTVSISDFRKKDGTILPSKDVTIRNVEYVHVTKPSGKLHKAGWYPDPLPRCEKPFNVEAGINIPVFFTVKTPENAAPGKYIANINLKSGLWEFSVPVELNVWDFTLPEIPFMRSGFGFSESPIKRYQNLDTEDEFTQVIDKYYQSFKAYKISPYGSYHIGTTVKGVNWNGGTFDPDTVYDGRYSYQMNGQREGSYSELIPVNPEHPYLLKWQAKTLAENQKYTVTVKCYDKDKKPIDWSLKWIVYEGSKNWRQDTLFIDTKDFFAFEDLPDYRPFPENARFASVQLYAYLPGSGFPSGTVWVDNFQFIDLKTGDNLLPEGDFEQDINKLELDIDFFRFDKEARKYLDSLGFTGFRTGFSGLRSGPFNGKKTGWYEGFIYGTPEYEKLTGLYFKGFQDHLEANGWLGKEYLYWVDEPKHEDYDYVREGMQTIHQAAPKLTRFITENNPGPEIMDVTEVGCPVFYKVEPAKVKEWSKKGREFWSYLMCWPKEPHVNLFIDSDAINMRMWIWMSYKYNLKGILVWRANKWNDERCSPPGVLQNIWEDPMTYKSGHGTPFGSAAEFGNGDGMFFYPPNRHPNTDTTKYLTGPVPSLRLEILREGLDDYDYMRMLEEYIDKAKPNQQALVKKAEKILNFGEDVFVNDTTYVKNPDILMKYREQMGMLLEKFSQSN